MSLRLVGLLFFGFGLACAGPEVETGDSEPEEIIEPEDRSCEVLEIRIDGEDPPTVGDEWTVLLFCDEALLTGATVMRVDPPEMATIDENRATFIESGEGTLNMQVGAYRQSRDISVSD